MCRLHATGALTTYAVTRTFAKVALGSATMKQHVLFHFDEAATIAGKDKSHMKKRDNIVGFWQQIPVLDPTSRLSVQPLFTSKQWDPKALGPVPNWSQRT